MHLWERFVDRILGTLSCFDRVVITGMSVDLGHAWPTKRGPGHAPGPSRVDSTAYVIEPLVFRSFTGLSPPEADVKASTVMTPVMMSPVVAVLRVVSTAVPAG